jgi:hypothetical protein
MPALFAYFSDGEIGVQRDGTIVQRSHSKCLEKPGKELGLYGFKP